MVKITKFDSNLSYTFACNVLSIKNNGTSEAEIKFLSNGDTLTVQRGQIVYVFNSASTVTDTIDVSFTTIGTTNEIEVIQTEFSNSNTTFVDDLTRIEERNVYVNIIPDVGLNKYDISTYQFSNTVSNR
jgi:hypothetical protein